MVRELAMWLLIGVAVSQAVDYFRQPVLPQNFASAALQTLDGKPVDLIAMSAAGVRLGYLVWRMPLHHAIRIGTCRRGRQRDVGCTALR